MQQKAQQSYGVIPINTKINKILVIQHQGGHWSFPKGRPEEGETPVETAKRELQEEVDIHPITLDTDTSFSEQYIFSADGFEIHKTVTYFIGYTDQEAFTIREQELKDARWCSYEEALDLLTYENAKTILKNAQAYRKKV